MSHTSYLEEEKTEIEYFNNGTSITKLLRNMEPPLTWLELELIFLHGDRQRNEVHFSERRHAAHAWLFSTQKMST